MKTPFATGKASGLVPNINVTPLVDVVLVLLIIFMVVLPSMQDDGKPIDMVKVKQADENDPDAPEPYMVTIDREEKYVLDDVELPRDAMLRGLKARLDAQPRRVLLRADASLRYQVVREVFREIQELGCKGVDLAVGTSREWTPHEERG